MEKRPVKNANGREGLFRALIMLAFFIALWLLVWLVIDPLLYFQKQQSVFSLDSGFFQEYAGYSGRMIQYFGAFLSQLFYYSWFGALVLVAGFALISLSTKRLGKIAAPKSSPLTVYLLPIIFLLGMYVQYTHPLAQTPRLLLVIVSVDLYFVLRPQNQFLRIVAFLVLSAVVYYLTAGLFIILGLLIVLIEALNHRRYLLIPAFLVSLSFPWLSAQYFFIISVSDAFWPNLPFNVSYIPAVLPYLLLLFYLLLVTTPRFLAVGFIEDLNQKISKYFQKRVLIKRISTVNFLLILAVLTVYFSFNLNTKKVLQVDYFARHEKTEAARTCLQILKKTILFDDWAESKWLLLDDPAKLQADSQLRHLKSMMPAEDFISMTTEPQINLISLLQANANNKMAYEYLMAYYLLTRQLDMFAADLKMMG